MQVKNVITKSLVMGAMLTSISAMAWKEAFEDVYVLGGVNYTRVDQARLAGSSSSNFGGEAFGNEMELESNGNIGWRGGIGTWINKHFAIEFNYFGVGNMHSEKSFFAYHDFSTAPAETYLVDADLHTKGMAFFDISGLGRFNLNKRLWSFLRVGIAYATVDREMSGTTQAYDANTGAPVNGEVDHFTAREDQGGIGLALGFGAQYDFTPMIGLRLEANTVQAENENNMYSIGANVVINFDDII